MKWTYGFIDIAKCRELGQHPEEYLARKGSERWQVLEGPVPMAPVDSARYQSVWVSYTGGDAVRIPLACYHTNSKDPAIALAMAVQIGGTALVGQSAAEIVRVHLSVGIPVEELDLYAQVSQTHVVDCYRFWLGIAVQLRN